VHRTWSLQDRRLRRSGAFGRGPRRCHVVRKDPSSSVVAETIVLENIHQSLTLLLPILKLGSPTLWRHIHELFDYERQDLKAVNTRIITGSQ